MTAMLWLGTYLLHSTVLCGAALLCRRQLRDLDAAELVWRAVALLPVLSATAMLWSGSSLWSLGIDLPGAPVSRDGLAAESSPFSTATVGWALMAAWALIGMLLIVRDWVSHWLFLRRLGERRPAGRTLQAEVSEVARLARLHRPVCVTHSDTVASPIALGRSEICLPTRVMHDLTPRQRRMLIAHEVAHLVRRDPLWFAILASIDSALFVQPLNRAARRELRQLAELSCDRWAARELADPTALADCLVEVAGWSRAGSPVMMPGAVGRSGLAERVGRLIESPRPAAGPSRLLCMAGVMAAALALPGLTMSSDPTTVSSSGARLADQSPEFMAGYELGRKYAERNGDRAPNPAAGATLRAGQAWRAELERTRQARAQSTPFGALEGPYDPKRD